MDGTDLGLHVRQTQGRASGAEALCGMGQRAGCLEPVSEVRGFEVRSQTQAPMKGSARGSGGGEGDRPAPVGTWARSLGLGEGPPWRGEGSVGLSWVFPARAWSTAFQGLFFTMCMYMLLIPERTGEGEGHQR